MIKNIVDSVAGAVGVETTNKAPTSSPVPQTKQDTPEHTNVPMPDATTGQQPVSSEGAAKSSGDVLAVHPANPIEAAKQHMDRDKGRKFTSATGARGSDPR